MGNTLSMSHPGLFHLSPHLTTFDYKFGCADLEENFYIFYSPYPLPILSYSTLFPLKFLFLFFEVSDIVRKFANRNPQTIL